MNKKKLCALVLTGVMAAQALGSSAYGAAFTDGTVQDTFSEEEQSLSEDAGSTGEPIAEPTPAAALTETPDKSEIFKGQESDVQNVEEVFSDGGEEDKFTSGSQEDEGQTGAVISEDGEKVYLDGIRYEYIPETDSYRVVDVSAGVSVSVVRAEINGKKVTEIGEDIYRIEYDDLDSEDLVYVVWGNIIIPDTVTKLADRAFAGGTCTVIDIPDSVTQIGKELFYRCAELRSIRFPAGVKVFPQGLFKECNLLETIEISPGVTEISENAMKGCPNLKKVFIPSSVTAIGENLFEESAQVSIYGEEGSYAQKYALEHQIPFVAEGSASEAENPVIDGVCYTYDAASDSYKVTGFNQDISEEVTFLNTVNGKSVTEIGENAFYYCQAVKKITVPRTIKKIGNSAFHYCTKLEGIILEEGVESLGDYVFCYDWALKEVKLPDTVTQFGACCFHDCRLDGLYLSKGLTEISDSGLEGLTLSSALTIPNGVSRIGTDAFSYFSGTEVILPSTVEIIADRAFYFAMLSEVNIPGSVQEIGVSAFEMTDVEKLNIPDSVTRLGKNVFRYCKAASITLGRGIRSIPEGAFEGTRAEALLIPDSVASIFGKAFRDTKFYRISIPASVSYIKKDAFSKNDFLTLFVKKNSLAEQYARAMKIPYDNGSIYASVVIKDGIQYQYNSGSGTYVVSKSLPDISGKVKIASAINKKKVVAIKDSAFAGQEKITEISIPKTVTSIGKDAFAYCGVKEINIPSSVTEIKDSTFNSSSLEKIVIPASVTAIRAEAFVYCQSLKEVIFPDTLKTLGRRSFYHCSSLEEIIIPGSVKTVPYECFDKCTSLKKVVLKDGVEEVESWFEGSEKVLREMHMTDSIRKTPSPKRYINCTFYGFSGTKIEEACRYYDRPFVSVGISVFRKPELTAKIFSGNSVEVYQKDRVRSADYFTYVLTKDKNFPVTGKYIYKDRKYKGSESCIFENLDNGTYYVFAQSARRKYSYAPSDKMEYSGWSAPVKVQITQTLNPCKIQKVTVKGNTVTVTVKSVPGAEGYGIVLSEDRSKDGCQKLLKPLGIKYGSKNNTSTTYTFKNVKPGVYCVLARAYKKLGGGQTVYSKWSGYSRMISL